MNRFMRSLLLTSASFCILLSGCSPKIDTAQHENMTSSVQEFSNAGTADNIDLTEQWAIIHTKSNLAWKVHKQKKQIKVAVVDTGVDYNHPDLKDRVLKEEGFNFINNSNDTMDDNWHGTHVAGIIAADTSNNFGVAGVVGNYDVKIIPVKVLNGKGEGSSDIMAIGIKYAADKGVDIINFSVGFDVMDPYIGEAIKYARSKGVFVVVSSGNNDRNSDFTSPAGDEGAYTVASINSNDEKSIFSNFGSSVKISAPGENILSTIPGGNYDYRNGTSMAAPIVAGAAAMMKAVNPNLTPEQIEQILNKTADDVMEKGKDKSTGFGILNAETAVEMADNYDKV
ncbi:S8 family serine peptidase [Clostridium swellfunianum]|uniref:S8 family serine peptidase n=1 Tax=Clostridium swellfunianum TaxID=1367462 RepID=UPI00202F6787|nr:S8 family serine peptidase [Clostridium swellfunianum]MCM0646953.1 S8 family serine peptidase [Clostridium swellfunianum]